MSLVSVLTAFQTALSEYQNGNYESIVSVLRKIVLEYTDNGCQVDFLSRAFVLELLAEFDILISAGTVGSSDYFFSKCLQCLSEIYGDEHTAFSDYYMIISVTYLHAGLFVFVPVFVLH